MTVVLLPPAVLQFCDGNGVPYASGTLATYVPGTTTPKDTWSDQAGTVLNDNPIRLDAAGRCIIWADGVYRCVLSDADGNLVFDQLSTTIVSQAMAPVVMAPTIAEAVRLLGIQDLIDAEAAARAAADAALQSQLDAKADQSALDAEIARAQAAEAALRADLDAEIARAKAAEDALQAQIDGAAGAGTAGIREGTATTDNFGRLTVVNDPPFPSKMTGLDAWVFGTAFPEWPSTDRSNMYNLDYTIIYGPATPGGIDGVLVSGPGDITDPLVATVVSWRSYGI